MNSKRRSELKKAITLLNGAQENLEAAKEIVDNIHDEEEESYDNLPEGVQESERGENMAENVDSLDTITTELDDIYSNVGEQIDAIQEVIDR